MIVGIREYGFASQVVRAEFQALPRGLRLGFFN